MVGDSGGSVDEAGKPAHGVDASGVRRLPRVSRALEIARRAERFDEVERSDPVMAFVHLVAACAWMATVSIARAPEGIAFGILVAVAAVRVPRTARLYPGLFASGAFVLFLAFVEWQVLSVLWSSAPNLGVRDMLPRFVFVPLALWPVMHRWTAMMVALVAGAAVHGGVLTGVAIARTGWRPGQANGLLTKDICMTGVAFAVAVGAVAGRPWGRGWFGGASRGGALVTLVLGQLILGQRMPVIASAAGGAVAVARPRPGRRHAPWAWIGVGAVAIAVAGGFLAASPRNRAWISSSWSLVAADAGTVTDDRLMKVTGARLPLVRLGLELWWEHPVFGHGARSYALASKDRFTCAPADYGVPPTQSGVMSALACAHNAFLDEASERGIVGVGLLVALLAACWWRAWRLDPWSGTAGMLGVWTVACLTQSMTVRGVAVLLLAVIVARCAFVERDP